jgi:ribose transport system ATP-binding protein
VSGDAILEVGELSKTFFGQLALDRVSLDVQAGQVHALVGHNGSGKSTLIKILAGYHLPDDTSAEVRVGGETLRFGNPKESHRLGLRFLHQDLGLVPELTVLENLHLGRPWSTAPGRRIRWRQERQEARELLRRVELDISPEASVARLGPIQRTQLAVARAFSHDEDARVLILDEPTAVLPSNEVDALFTLVRNALRQGVGVMYVSHRLEELEEIADYVTVLRDGQVVGRGPAEEYSRDKLVGLIVGDEHLVAPPSAAAVDTGSGDLRLKFENVSAGELRDASFSLFGGEVVGIAGLTGSGVDDVATALQQRVDLRSGSITVGPAEKVALGPTDLIASGVAVLPAERDLKSVQTMTVRENLTLPDIGNFWSGLRLRLRRERSVARDLVDSFGIRPGRIDAELLELSGGNQQKVNLAKWLRTDPQVLVLAEPTQGVDVGGKDEVLAFVRQAAGNGTAVLICSSDVYELESVCSRILVIREGRITTELSGAAIEASRIAQECFGTE